MNAFTVQLLVLFGVLFSMEASAEVPPDVVAVQGAPDLTVAKIWKDHPLHQAAFTLKTFSEAFCPENQHVMKGCTEKSFRYVQYCAKWKRGKCDKRAVWYLPSLPTVTVYKESQGPMIGTVTVHAEKPDRPGVYEPVWTGMLPEVLQPFQDEIARLKEEVAANKTRIAGLEVALAVALTPPASAPSPKIQLVEFSFPSFISTAQAAETERKIRTFNYTDWATLTQSWGVICSFVAIVVFFVGLVAYFRFYGDRRGVRNRSRE